MHTNGTGTNGGKCPASRGNIHRHVFRYSAYVGILMLLLQLPVSLVLLLLLLLFLLLLLGLPPPVLPLCKSLVPLLRPALLQRSFVALLSQQ